MDGHRNSLEMESIPLEETQSHSSESKGFVAPLYDATQQEHEDSHNAAEQTVGHHDYQTGESGRSTGDNTPGQSLSRSGGRRVQWILDDSKTKDHQSIPMDGEAPSYISTDYFGRRPSNADAESSGTATPADPYSGSATPDTSRPPSPQEHADILDGETDGLPQSSRPNRKLQRQAQRLISAHKAKSAFMSGSSRNKNAGVDPFQLSEALRKQGLGDQPTLPTPANPNPTPADGFSSRRSGRRVPTMGVLGSLMRLYDREDSNSMNSSQATLVSDAITPEARRTGHRTPPFTPAVINAFAQPVKKGTELVGKGTTQAVNKISKEIDDTDRPKSARSGAGVFGALGASALDLAGVASPRHATVKPAAERPGFKLSRFTLDSPQEESPPHTRPASASGTRSGTSTPGGRSGILRAGKPNLSMSNLGDFFDPTKLHSESQALKNVKSGSAPGTPKYEAKSFDLDEKAGARHRKKKDKKKSDEIYITMHVAAILQRQDFILRLARAHMMFGGPSHRFEAEMQRTARVLEIECQVIYLLSFAIISFQDPDTQTSSVRIIKQPAGLNLYKLKALAVIHWEVMHDKIGVQDASAEISRLMTAKPVHGPIRSIFIGGACSIFIGIAAFHASFIDLLVAFPLGCILVATQTFVASKSDVLSSIFEIFITAVLSFVAAAASGTGLFCYASLISSTIVLILPGWLVCNAALELQSRAIVTGSVRLVYSIIYSLFLGLGISIGAQIWNSVAPDRLQNINIDSTCAAAHTRLDGDTPWYQVTLSEWFYFLAVPAFPFFLALKNQAKFRTKEFLVTVLIAGCGWVANHFAARAFPTRSDVSSALGALAVGLLGNLWGKFFQGTGFIVSLVPIMFQLPSGLGNGGLLNFATNTDDASTGFSSSFSIAEQLITVALGLVIGLFAATVLVYPVGSNRAKGLMSF